MYCAPSDLHLNLQRTIYANKVFRLGKHASETHKELELDFREETMNRAQLCDWFSQFKSCEKLKCSRAPPMSKAKENVMQIREVISA